MKLENIKKLKNRLWFDIFLRVFAIFAVFLIVITLANSALLSRFFEGRQKNLLTAQITRLGALDLNDSAAVRETLTDISDNYGFDAEIYTARGKILYTTHGGKMMDFIINGRDNLAMSHERLEPVYTETLSNGIVFEESVRRFDKSTFLLCRTELQSEVYAEVRVQRQIITATADAANEFIIAVAIICFLPAALWVLFFAKKFSRPLVAMNEITRDMADLKFCRKIETDRTDEIGELAASINEMSDSLSATLLDLQRTNARLRDEIELERSLDAMRKGFVANVSHELKTPLAIISGYAEGLKLNVNESSRDSYCDTIIDESRRMNELVLSILELSRYESGQMPIKREAFCIREITERTAERIFKGADVIIQNNIENNVTIFADLLQTEQVLKSYLENAKAHTPSGGEVTLDAQDRGDKIRIIVHNTGSHVDEEIMPQIWQSFYRGDASHKRESNRFGLGLSIVNAIMKMHGNACGVYNTNTGVAFWFEADKAR